MYHVRYFIFYWRYTTYNILSSIADIPRTVFYLLLPMYHVQYFIFYCRYTTYSILSSIADIPRTVFYLYCRCTTYSILSSIATNIMLNVFQVKNWISFSFMHIAVELWWAHCVEWMCYRVLPGWCSCGGGSVSVVFVFMLVCGVVKFVYTHACCGEIHDGMSCYMTLHRRMHECKQTWQHRQLAQTQTQHSLFHHRSNTNQATLGNIHSTQWTHHYYSVPCTK